LRARLVIGLWVWLWASVAWGAPPDCRALEGGCGAEAARRWASRDWAALRALLEPACQREGAAHCARLSILWEGGLGGPKDPARAFALQDRACREGGPEHCARAASMARLLDAPYDLREVVAAYAQRCDGDDLSFCASVAALFEDGQGVTRDDDQARELHRLTCARGFQAGCRRYAIALLQAPPDEALHAEARRLLQQACHQPRTVAGACVGGQAQACYDLGLLLEDGIGGDAVPKHALSLFDRACREDSALGCALAALRRWESTDPAAHADARARFDALAQGAAPRGLQAAALMLQARHELARPREALALLLQLCDRDHGPSCAQANALLPSAPRDLLQSLHARLERDCATGKPCAALALVRHHLP
jgi:TPR repeat protein